MELVLKDGTRLEGEAFGFKGSVAGELVFNTGMTGYVEAMTDPSYYGQIVVFTYPLVGNYGVQKAFYQDELLYNFESTRIHPKAIVIGKLSDTFSHHKAQKSLSAWMEENRVAGISGLDTRHLTHKLRDQGSTLAKLVYNEQELDFYDPNQENLIAKVSPEQPQFIDRKANKTVVVVDTGAKNRIFHLLLQHPLNILRVPWNYDYRNEKFDGILLTNGPGDPNTALETAEQLLPNLYKCPVLGICLGHQILAKAIGVDTYKLKFGHRSQNQPCTEVGSKKTIITSQNHGYAVQGEALPSEFMPWFFNANDGSNEGIRHKTRPIFSVQFHPEACPGPKDAGYILDMFVHQVLYS